MTELSTSLADLPTELLYQIFQDLGQSDLLSLAKLCRRLNAVAVRQCYKLVDLDVDSNLLYLGSKAVDTLNTLLLDVTNPHFTYITTSFDAPYGPVLTRLRAYLQMLPSGSVKSLAIQFPAHTTHSPPKAFSNALSHLLGSACLQNCESLRLSHLDMTRFRRPNTVHISSPPLQTLDQMTLSRSAGHIPSRVHDWLIQSANSSRLTYLFLDGTDLTSTLGKLCLPCLKMLFLSSPNLSARDVSSFVTKHRFITDLQFYGCHWSNATVVAPDTLPLLESLSGSPSVVLPFLSNCKRGRLKRISLHFNRPTTRRLGAKVVKLLCLISDHLALSHLTFEFSDKADPDFWAQPWWWHQDGLRFPKIPRIDIIFTFIYTQPTFSSPLFARWVGLFPDLNRLKVTSSKLKVSDGVAIMKSLEESRLVSSCFKFISAHGVIIRRMEKQMFPEDGLEHFAALNDVESYGDVKIVISPYDRELAT